MTPFMQLRIWLREGPRGEVLGVAVATALIAATIAWAVAPTGTAAGPGDAASVSAGGAATAEPKSAPAAPAPVDTGPAPTSAPAPTVGPSSPTPAAPTGPASASPPSSPSPTATASPATAAASAPAGSACDNRATDKGVTANQVLVGVIIYSLGEANPALGIPPAKDTVKMYNAVFDHYNELGGIQCRKLVPKFYEEFVLDSSSGHAACLKMQQDGVFALMNNLFTVQNRNCPLQAGIPNFWATSADTATVHQFHPYVMSFQADYDRLFRDYVFGAKFDKFFDGMNKLGILSQTCYPDRPKALLADLARIGIGRDKLSIFDYGCPTSAAGVANQNLSAVLQFRREGVTHVMNAFREAPSGFADAAEQQNFHPKYAFMDDQFSSLANNANPPWSSNLDGAIIIEKSGEGAEYTPGATFTQATRDCEAITRSAGLPGPTNTGTLEGSLHALACIHTKMFFEAAKRTMPLTRRGLASGLAQVGKLDLSFPAGPADFHDPALPIGAQFWRTSAYHADCTCVKLLDPTWRPEFH